MAGITAMWCIVVVAAVVSSASRGALAAVGCGTVVSDISPCLPYVTGPAPLGNCCSGVKALYAAARTTPDRQSVCNCLKQLVSTYRVDIGKASGLPSKCGVNIPYKIDPSTDCAKVQ